MIKKIVCNLNINHLELLKEMVSKWNEMINV